MSWNSRNPPDLATFGDLDAVLNKIGDITVREPIRQYYRILYYVQQIRSAKWCLFALFITMFLEFEIKAFFPASFQTQAFIALVIAFIVLTVLWVFEYATFTYGGDPAELFTHEEDLEIARRLANVAVNALPAASIPIASANMGALFEMPSSKTTTHAKGERAPMAKINGGNPRSPVNLNLLPQYRSSGSGQVRAGLLSFNPTLSRPVQYSSKKK